jgi:hypothetical protein
LIFSIKPGLLFMLSVLSEGLNFLVVHCPVAKIRKSHLSHALFYGFCPSAGAIFSRFEETIEADGLSLPGSGILSAVRQKRLEL